MSRWRYTKRRESDKNDGCEKDNEKEELSSIQLRHIMQKLLRVLCFYSTKQSSIPILDLSKSYDTSRFRYNIGFFVIVGHSIDETIQDEMMKISQEFFHLSLSIKREITGSKDYSYGYNNLNNENLSLGYDKSSSLSDLKESFSIAPEHEQLGDLMSPWTIDRWRSTPHRVILLSNPTKDNGYSSRESIAFFCQIHPDENR